MTRPSPGAYMSCEYRVPGSWAAGYHTGRDWANPHGSPVVATRAGTVVAAGWQGDYGNQLVIETEGIRHYYNHLARFVAGYGDTVAQGQVVGVMGDTGNATGPHVHYEERTYGSSGYGYNDHREPLWDGDDGVQEPAGGAGSIEEDDMFVIQAPNRSPALMGPGYVIAMDAEQAQVMTDCGVRLIYHNDRGWDVARATMLQGVDSVSTD